MNLEQLYSVVAKIIQGDDDCFVEQLVNSPKMVDKDADEAFLFIKEYIENTLDAKRASICRAWLLSCVGNPKEAIDIAEALSRDGYPIANVFIEWMRFNGKGIDKDMQLAMGTIKSLKKSEPRAMALILAEMKYKNLYSKKDPIELFNSLQLFQEAVTKGSKYAQVRIENIIKEQNSNKDVPPNIACLMYYFVNNKYSQLQDLIRNCSVSAMTQLKQVMKLHTSEDFSSHDAYGKQFVNMLAYFERVNPKEYPFALERFKINLNLREISSAFEIYSENMDVSDKATCEDLITLASELNAVSDSTTQQQSNRVLLKTWMKFIDPDALKLLLANFNEQHGYFNKMPSTLHTLTEEEALWLVDLFVDAVKQRVNWFDNSKCLVGFLKQFEDLIVDRISKNQLNTNDCRWLALESDAFATVLIKQILSKSEKTSSLKIGDYWSCLIPYFMKKEHHELFMKCMKSIDESDYQDLLSNVHDKLQLTLKIQSQTDWAKSLNINVKEWLSVSGGIAFIGAPIAGGVGLVAGIPLSVWYYGLAEIQIKLMMTSSLLAGSAASGVLLVLGLITFITMLSSMGLSDQLQKSIPVKPKQFASMPTQDLKDFETKLKHYHAMGLFGRGKTKEQFVENPVENDEKKQKI